MNNPKFNVGDIVKLKSGGPNMTVKAVLGAIDLYDCQWFAGKKLNNGKFSEESLIAVEESND